MYKSRKELSSDSDTPTSATTAATAIANATAVSTDRIGRRQRFFSAICHMRIGAISSLRPVMNLTITQQDRPLGSRRDLAIVRNDHQRQPPLAMQSIEQVEHILAR